MSDEASFTEKEQKEILHSMWELHFEVVASSSISFNSEELMMFWNQMGWLGKNGMIHPEGFDEIGFLDNAVSYINRFVSEVGYDSAQEHIGPIIDFVESHWSGRLEGIRGSANFFAEEGEVSGSVSTG